jgi:hypothetical protein
VLDNTESFVKAVKANVLFDTNSSYFTDMLVRWVQSQQLLLNRPVDYDFVNNVIRGRLINPQGRIVLVSEIHSIDNLTYLLKDLVLEQRRLDTKTLDWILNDYSLKVDNTAMRTNILMNNVEELFTKYYGALPGLETEKEKIEAVAEVFIYWYLYRPYTQANLFIASILATYLLVQEKICPLIVPHESFGFLLKALEDRKLEDIKELFVGLIAKETERLGR